jgi:hypothetical protein
MKAMQLRQHGLLRPPTLGSSVLHRAVCRRRCAQAPKAADVAVSKTSETAEGSQKSSSLIIGCRGSKLSLQQAQQVHTRLALQRCLHALQQR